MNNNKNPWDELILSLAYALKLDVVVEWLAKVLNNLTEKLKNLIR